MAVRRPAVRQSFRFVLADVTPSARGAILYIATFLYRTELQNGLTSKTAFERSFAPCERDGVLYNLPEGRRRRTDSSGQACPKKLGSPCLL